jgi:hypothetical protein
MIRAISEQVKAPLLNDDRIDRRKDALTEFEIGRCRTRLFISTDDFEFGRRRGRLACRLKREADNRRLLILNG